MRTTVTLDDDLAAALRLRAAESNRPFKRVLNETLRAALSAGEPARRPYAVPARNLGIRPGISITKALDLLGDLEDSELQRKLEQSR